jgi:hypothetical protein
MDGGKPLLEGCKRLNRLHLLPIRSTSRDLCGWQRRGGRVHRWRSDARLEREVLDWRGDRRTRWWGLRHRLRAGMGDPASKVFNPRIVGHPSC